MNNFPQILFDFDDREWTIEIIKAAFNDLQQNINNKVCPHSLLVNENNSFTYILPQCQCQLNDKNIDHTKIDILRYLLSKSSYLNHNQRLAIFNRQEQNKQNISIDLRYTSVHCFYRRNVYLQQILKLKKLNDTYGFRYIAFKYSEKFDNFHLILTYNRNNLKFDNYQELRFNLKHFLIFIQLAVLNNITIQINQRSLVIGESTSRYMIKTIQIQIDEINEKNMCNDQFINFGELLHQQIELQQMNEDSQLIPLSTLSEYLISGNIKSLNYVIQFLDNDCYQNFQSPMFIDTEYIGLQQLNYNRLRYRIYFIHKTLEYCRQFIFLPQIGNQQINQINHGFNYILYTIQDQTIREFLMLLPDELPKFTYEVHFHIYQYIQFHTMNQLVLNNMQQIQYYQAQQTIILEYLNLEGPQNNLQFLKIKFRLKLLLSRNFDYYLRVLYFTKNYQRFNFNRQQIENWEQTLQNLDVETILDLIQQIG